MKWAVRRTEGRRDFIIESSLLAIVKTSQVTSSCGLADDWTAKQRWHNGNSFVSPLTEEMKAQRQGDKSLLQIIDNGGDGRSEWRLIKPVTLRYLYHPPLAVLQG